MTVKELIKQLKKMPQNAIVYYQDFDCETYGISSAPNSVVLIDFDKDSENNQEYQNEMRLKGECVVLRS